MINGHALGAAFIFAMSHDFRVMREDKGFLGLPEIALGMPIPPGGHAAV